MKKIVNFSMAALVVMGTILAGCAKNEVAEPETNDNIVTVTTTVGLGENDATKALDIDYVNKKVTKTFGDGEQVALVYYNTSEQLVKAVATAENISADGKSASFTFTLVNPLASQTVFYYYPAALVDESAKLSIPIATQDGTLSNVESLDYAYNTGYMSGTTLPASVTLENKFAIVAFTLKDATGNNDITSTITGMTISDGTNDYTVTRSAAAGPIYVVMRPTEAATINITATDGSKYYTKTLTGKTWAANNFYQQGLRMTDSTPLTVEALTAGTVNVVIDGTLSTGMKYAVNGGAKTLITTSTDISVSAGDRVQFYGNGTNTQVYGVSSKVKIQGSGTGFTCKAYGNIMSLLDETGYATKTDLPNQNSVFAYLFSGNTALTDAGDLLLPATTLTQRCYSSMFSGCNALTAVPALPATTLAQYCYSSMFNGCTALTTAPDLLATTLVTGCYNNMFYGCTNLTSVKCLATTVNNSNHTNQWLHNVAATGTVHIASGLVWSQGANGIPSGWTGRYPDGTIMSNPFPMADATSGDVGKVIGVDGKVYISIASATNAGTTAVAVLVYVGSDTDNTTYTHGLAIAMSNEGRQLPADAVSTCAGKTAVSGGQWQLPSLAQWKTMIKACSGDDLIHYALNTLITNAGGATLYVDEVSYYWTSTNTSPYIYSVKIPNDYQADYVRHNVNDKLLVRACLAF